MLFFFFFKPGPFTVAEQSAGELWPLIKRQEKKESRLRRQASSLKWDRAKRVILLKFGQNVSGEEIIHSGVG